MQSVSRSLAESVPADRAARLHPRPARNTLRVEGMHARAWQDYDLLTGLEGLEADSALVAFGDEFLRGPDRGRKGDLWFGLHAEVQEHEEDEERNDHDQQYKRIHLRPDHYLRYQNDVQQSYLCLSQRHLHPNGESRCQYNRR